MCGGPPLTSDPPSDVTRALERLTHNGDGSDRQESDRVLLDLAARLLASARRAGVRAVLTGRWLVDTVVDMAPRIPVRDRATLVAHHPGVGREQIADRLIDNAVNVTTALGFASGSLVAIEELLPPSWPAVPFELAVEAMLVIAVEMKLVGELHALYGHPLPEPLPDRAATLLRSWATGRGMHLGFDTHLTDVLGPAGRLQLVRRIMRRFGRSTTGAIPFFVGGVVAAGLNRNGTRRLAERIRSDLR